MELNRVAYVVKRFPMLTQTFVVGEVCELRRRGLEVGVLSLLPSDEELRHDIVARDGLDEITVYGGENFAMYLKRFRPQLLHAHFATDPAAAARELANKINLPFTFTAHGYDIYYRPPADFRERAAAAAAIVTVSSANKDHITRTFGVPPEHTRVIRNGVDTNFFRPLSERNPTSGLPLIVCIARHSPVKNLALLLQACAILRDRGVEFRCRLIGDGPDRGELEGLCRYLRLNAVVEMVGEITRDGVLESLQRATVCVLTSDSEGMPISLIEAAACEVPAVATRVGGIPELVEHGITGLLTAKGDASGFARALEEVFKDPRRTITMGQAARHRVEEKFSLAFQVEQLLALWEEVNDKIW